MRISLSRPDEDTDAFFADTKVMAILSDLRRISARGEYLRETLWAHKVISSSNPRITFREMPFHGNYRKLVNFEMSGARAAVTRPIERALMIGCGPMPMTVIMLAQSLGIEVSGIDASHEATRLARAFCDAVGVDASIYECDVMEFRDYARYDYVILAAGVGLEREERLKYIAHLARQMSSGAALVVRTAQGMRRLMFPQISPRDLVGFDCKYLIQPLDRVVNSMIIAEKS